MPAIDEINKLINEYEFPLQVLTDINSRLSDCRDESYTKQQLRYLMNLVKSGWAKKKEVRNESRTYS